MTPDAVPVHERGELVPDSARLRTLFEQALYARILDERMCALQRQGKAQFMLSCQGHEMAQVAFATALRAGVDWVAPHYRDLALTLALGMSPREQLQNVLARASDPNSGGRQMQGHYGSRRLRFMTRGSPVATQFPQACGIAWASRMRGEDCIVAVFTGDGGTSEGDFYEGLNFAVVHCLPIVCFVENNGIAISVPLEKQMATPRVSDRAMGFGIPGTTVDGGDPLACIRAAEAAVQRARSGGGPSIVEADVVRLKPHSSDDDDRAYRSPDEMAREHRRDGLSRVGLHLESTDALKTGESDALRVRFTSEIDALIETVLAEPIADPESSLLHVYAEEV